MRYVLLGKLSPEWIDKGERFTNAKAKAEEQPPWRPIHASAVRLRDGGVGQLFHLLARSGNR